MDGCFHASTIMYGCVIMYLTSLDHSQCRILNILMILLSMKLVKLYQVAKQMPLELIVTF
jgi:hypothetical protein